MDFKERLYIRHRKIKAGCQSMLFLLCRVMPIDNKLVSVCAFEGKKGFSCNPRYIVEELHKRDSNYKFVWFVNDMSVEVPDYIKKVKNNFWNRAFWLTKSKIWIDNYRKPYGVIKRKKQLYINTWHGNLGFKATGLMRGKAFSPMAYLVSKNDSDMVDFIPADSALTEEVYRKCLLFDGPFLRVGSARCDVLYSGKEDARKQLRDKYSLSEEDRILMYAPTFREASQNGKRSVFEQDNSLDFKSIINAFEDHFGGSWYLCLKLHPQVANTSIDSDEYEYGKIIINESLADDMCEIMAGVDAYISDYSGAAFDAAVAGIPVFIYADDILEYETKRGGLMWDMSSSDKYVSINREIFKDYDCRLPFTVSKSNDELVENIMKFDSDEYESVTKSFFVNIDEKFDGRASIRVVDEIIRRINDN